MSNGMRESANRHQLKNELKQLKHHDHACLIYESQDEWQSTIVPFLRDGLDSNAKCIYLADEHDPDLIRSVLQEAGVDTVSVEASGQLIIRSAAEVVSALKLFDPERMISLLYSETQKLLDEGYSTLRISGEMSWVLKGIKGAEKFLEYEALSNRDYCDQLPVIAICQYNRSKFDPAVIKEIILTHPKVIAQNKLYHNAFFIPTSQYLDSERNRLEVDQIIRSLEQLKHREDSLRQNYNLLQTIIDGTSDCIYIKDNKGRYLLHNRSFANTLGKNISDIIGHDDRYLYPPNEAKWIMYEDNRIIQERKTKILEEVVTVNNNERKTFLTVKGPVYDTDNSVTGLFGIARDITDLKKTEDELKYQRDMARQYLDIAGTMIVVLNEKGTIELINKKAAQIIGWSEEEIAGKNWFDIVWPENLKNEGKKGLNSFLENRGGPQEYDEHLIITRNGQERLIAWHRALITDKLGKVIGVISSGEDITEKRAQEKQINMLNRLYATLSDINQEVVRVKSREELFRAVCEIAVRSGKFCMAWIGLLDEEGLSIPQVSCGYENGYLDAYIGYTKGKKATPVKRIDQAVKNGELVIEDDLSAACQGAPWLNAALERGYKAMAILPIKVRGSIIGHFTIYNDQPGFFSEEKHLLEEMALDISFALDMMEAEKERQEAERNLQDSLSREKYLADLIRKASIAIVIGYPDGSMGMCNHAFAKLTGYAEEELKNMRYDADLTPPEWHAMEKAV